MSESDRAMGDGEQVQDMMRTHRIESWRVVANQKLAQMLAMSGRRCC